MAGWVHSVRLDCGPPSCRRQKLRQPLDLLLFIYFYLFHETPPPHRRHPFVDSSYTPFLLATIRYINSNNDPTSVDLNSN